MPGASELVGRFDETVAWCSLKKSSGELPYDRIFLSPPQPVREPQKALENQR